VLFLAVCFAACLLPECFAELPRQCHPAFIMCFVAICCLIFVLLRISCYGCRCMCRLFVIHLHSFYISIWYLSSVFRYFSFFLCF
jgi:hypothetical protein